MDNRSWSIHPPNPGEEEFLLPVNNSGVPGPPPQWLRRGLGWWPSGTGHRGLSWRYQPQLLLSLPFCHLPGQSLLGFGYQLWGRGAVGGELTIDCREVERWRGAHHQLLHCTTPSTHTSTG